MFCVTAAFPFPLQTAMHMNIYNSHWINTTCSDVQYNGEYFPQIRIRSFPHNRNGSTVLPSTTGFLFPERSNNFLPVIPFRYLIMAVIDSFGGADTKQWTWSPSPHSNKWTVNLYRQLSAARVPVSISQLLGLISSVCISPTIPYGS